MNRNLKDLHGDSDDNIDKENGIDDLAQELDEEEWLDEPVQQALANLLETFWQNPQSYEKIKDKIKIYVRRKNFSSFIVKKCSEETWLAHLTHRDRARLTLSKN